MSGYQKRGGYKISSPSQAGPVDHVLKATRANLFKRQVLDQSLTQGLTGRPTPIGLFGFGSRSTTLSQGGGSSAKSEDLWLDRDSDHGALRLAYDLSVPDSGGLSVALRNARTVNRGEEKKLHDEIGQFQCHLVSATRRIDLEEKYIKRDLQKRSNTAVDMKTLRNTRSGSFGVYPVRAASQSSTKRTTTASSEDNDCTTPRSRTREDHFVHLPPLKKQLHVGLVLAKQPAKRKENKRIFTERTCLTLAGTKYFNGSAKNPKVRNLSGNEFNTDQDNDGSKLPDLTNELLTPTLRNTRVEKTPRGVNVTHFVDSDFGFRQERLKESTGMSLQKVLSNESDLQKDIESTAKRHIYALQTPSLSYRGSKATEGVRNLRDWLQPTITSSGSNIVIVPTSKTTRVENPSPQNSRDSRPSLLRERTNNKFLMGRLNKCTPAPKYQPHPEAIAIVGKGSG